MTENKFLMFVLTEGILLLVLGLTVLILPKISFISFGFLICVSFIVYGIFKIICALFTRNFSRHYILDILEGLILAVAGFSLFAIPVFDIALITGLGGIYFILKSISSSAFSVQTRKTLNFWWMCMFLAIFEFFSGIIIIITIPSSALWLVGVAAGLDFVLSGMVLLNMYISTKYIQG